MKFENIFKRDMTTAFGVYVCQKDIISIMVTYFKGMKGKEYWISKPSYKMDRKNNWFGKIRFDNSMYVFNSIFI